jgi:hypothetical protein
MDAHYDFKGAGKSIVLKTFQHTTDQYWIAEMLQVISQARREATGDQLHDVSKVENLFLCDFHEPLLKITLPGH